MPSSNSFYISGSDSTIDITYTIPSKYTAEVMHFRDTRSGVSIVSGDDRSYSSAVILFVFNDIGTGYSPYGVGGRDYINRYNIGFKLYGPTEISNNKYPSSADDMKVAYILF